MRIREVSGRNKFFLKGDFREILSKYTIVSRSFRGGRVMHLVENDLASQLICEKIRTLPWAYVVVKRRVSPRGEFMELRKILGQKTLEYIGSSIILDYDARLQKEFDEEEYWRDIDERINSRVYVSSSF